MSHDLRGSVYSWHRESEPSALESSLARQHSLASYLSLMRLDHWFKNIFVLPGTVIAAVLTKTSLALYAWDLVIGLASVCLLSSANYVVNEWLDAQYDRFHPIKRTRPAVCKDLRPGIVYSEYAFLAGSGLGLALVVSEYFLATAFLFLCIGVVYNVTPLRAKDVAYLDVLTESLNNPIRLAFGWFLVTSEFLPPSSLLFGYWMAGAFLMGVKRYAELRFLIGAGAAAEAAQYRRSFGVYTQESLLISSFFYHSCAAFFLGVFLIKYRIELLLALPLLAGLFTWYLYIGMKADSPAQNPERLFREKAFGAYVMFLVVVCGLLMTYDMPGLGWLLEGTVLWRLQ